MITESPQAPPLLRGAWHTFLLVTQPQAKLEGSWLIALSADGAEAGIAEILVWITEVRAVENIAAFCGEPHPELFAQRELLEDA